MISAALPAAPQAVVLIMGIRGPLHKGKQAGLLRHHTPCRCRNSREQTMLTVITTAAPEKKMLGSAPPWAKPYP